MDYCIVNSDGIIENIIVCEDYTTAANFGGIPSYDGAVIGEKYSPPPSPPTTDELLKRVDDGEIIIPSSTAGSTKKFKLTVDDTGTVSATEVTS